MNDKEQSNEEHWLDRILRGDDSELVDILFEEIIEQEEE